MSRTVLIGAGNYQAKLTSIGAGLVALRRQHPAFGWHELVVPHEEDEVPVGFMGKVLVPWPNRVTEGKYSFEGEDFQLAINEVSTGAALHGLKCWSNWEVVGQNQSSVTFATDICPQPCYPHSLHCVAVYQVSATHGLSLTVTTTNLGDTVAPYGASTHPYLTCNLQPVDRCVLTIPAGKVWQVDQRLHPTELRLVEELDLDYRAGKTIDGQEIDHAFGQLQPGPAQDGFWHVSLRDPATDMAVVMESDEPWVQVYSGTNIDRVGVAVEPMTCPPDAFNSGIDLIELAPGESTVFTCRIFAQ